MGVPTPEATRRSVRFYIQRAWRYKPYMIGLCVSLPLTVLVHQFLPPLLLAHVLSRLSRQDYTRGDVWGSFGPEIMTYAALVLIGGIFAWRIVDYFAFRLEGKVMQDIAQHVYRHLIAQSARFHADHFGGSLVSQTNKLQNGYVRVADTTIYQVAPLFCSLIFAAVLLSGRAPLFVAVLLAFAAIYIAIALIVTRPVRNLNAAHSAAESEQTGYLADSITNVMAIQSFAGGTYEQKRFGKATEKTRGLLMDYMRGFTRQLYYFSSLTNSILVISMVLGIVSVVMFDANIGTIFLIVTYTANIVSQLFTFSNNSIRNYNRSLGDASDMVGILNEQPEIRDPAKPERSRIKAGAIHFDHVVFSHDGGNDALFTDLDLRIQAGQKIGLIGRSGSGKTTLTRILLRFSDIDGGAIRLDGQDIRHITQDALRDNIAYVPQEPLLFHRSLRDNIRYGRAKATQADVVRVSKLAHADDFIRNLPDGYDTLVGERGVKLSGGQRQRVAIARALLKDAPILLLDEATSALDSESEAYIQDALWKLMEGRTAIVVAHRLSTIQKMDRIIVLDNGKILEDGTHKALLEQKGVYADMWNRQSGGFMED